MPERPFRCVGVYYHPRLDEARQLAEDVQRWFAPHVDRIWASEPWDPDRSTEHLPATDLLICLGGDGTILRAARAAAPHGALILGVDHGRLAFLTELAPDSLHDHIPKLLAREFVIEERAMLQAAPAGAAEDAPETLPALNDVMLGRGSLGQPAYLHVHVNGDLIGVVRADAIVVASATGSTGYSLSAGGPILHPRARSFVLTPVAPHLAAAAPLVLPSDAEIQLALGREHAGALSVDGQRPYAISPGGGVRVKLSDSMAKFVRFGERPFFPQLGRRLAWLDERRLRAVQRTGVEAFDPADADPA